MRRLAALLLPVLLLAGCGGDDDGGDDTAATTAPTTVAPSSTTASGPPSDLCQELSNAVGADSEQGRQEAIDALHGGLAQADAGVHDALATLEAELRSPQDGEAMNTAMETLNAELGCGG